LKLTQRQTKAEKGASPARTRAWIETPSLRFHVTGPQSPARTRAWIETKPCYCSCVLLGRRPLARGRGLKLQFLEQFPLIARRPLARGRGLKLAQAEADPYQAQVARSHAGVD